MNTRSPQDIEICSDTICDDAQVYADGSIEFSPGTNAAVCLRCGGGPVKLSGADVIGASKVGDENAFLVYHCARNSNGRRKLFKVGHFKCEDPDTTLELIGQIRQGASSREELQPYGKTILAVVNPMAGKGGYAPNPLLLCCLCVPSTR